MHWRFAVLDVLLPFPTILADTHQRGTGPQSIDVDIDPTARTEDAKHLADYLLRLIGVMKNSVRINIIEAVIAERKIPRVGFMDDCAVADSLARQFYMFCSQIYTGSQSTMLCELQQIAARPASDFEDLFSLMFAKLRDFVEPGIGRVPLLFS